MAGHLSRVRMILEKIGERGGFDEVFSKLKVISAGSDHCTCEMVVCKEHENRNGVLHGGMTASLIDKVSTLALMVSEKEVSGVSINMNISYLRPVKTGEEIIIEAKTINAGRTIAFCAVDIRNKKTGKLVATGQHTKYIG